MYTQNKTKYHRTTQQQGLTIVEMLVALAVGTIVLVALGVFTLSFYRTNAYAIEQSFAVNSARKGIENMVKDLREMTYSDEGSFPIISAQQHSVSFYSDVDRDSNIERIRFVVVDGLLKRELTKAQGNPHVYPINPDITSIVSDHVRNINNGVPSFTYYDAQGVEVTNLSRVTDIVSIKVNVIVNINPARLPSDFSLRSSATLRNLKTNL